MRLCFLFLINNQFECNFHAARLFESFFFTNHIDWHLNYLLTNLLVEDCLFKKENSVFIIEQTLTKDLCVSIVLNEFFCIAGIDSQRKSSESDRIRHIPTSITTQAQPLIQSSPELQSIQQPAREQHRHTKPQTNDRSESAARSTSREARPTGARPRKA